ncbi:hypothetical protein [Caballeronia catudaia]|uniref:hypothetical protein n=1 Tax=Caballeronia catudaia TaxID=1777136 RepID=UPI000772502C|nr:hypothetical protein [Caballeronia catudaia]
MIDRVCRLAERRRNSEQRQTHAQRLGRRARMWNPRPSSVYATRSPAIPTRQYRLQNLLVGDRLARVRADRPGATPDIVLVSDTASEIGPEVNGIVVISFYDLASSRHRDVEVVISLVFVPTNPRRTL